jgi:hypothetical protein
MTLKRLALSMLLLATAAFAAAIDGKWTATFDTQIGVQNYTYDLKADGSKLTGKATSANGESEIQEGKIEGDNVSFVENLMYQGMTIRIEYTGKIAGDQIKFTRKVADFATEEIVAKREK